MKKLDRTKASHTGVNPQEATIPEELEEDLLDSPVRKQKKDIVQIDASSLRKQSRKKNKRARKKASDKVSQSPTGSSTTSATTSTINATSKDGETLMMKRRKRRNGVASRVSYMVSIDSDDNSNNTNLNRKGSRGTVGGAQNSVKKPQTIPLPLNQYVTTLCRRAIRKREGDNNPPSPKNRSNNPRTQDGKKREEEDEDQGNNTTGLQLEEYGDISLGMNIGLVRGKVIVRGLNPLADGRASPAQVVGIIRRGDVLLSINNKSLVNLPINLMMERLGPLSTPDSTGAYQRWLQLRIEAAAGLELLEEEAAEARKASAAPKNEASEVFSLFPMADHMSGVPSFENNIKLPPSTITNPASQSSRRHPPQHRHQEEKKQTEEDTAAAPSSSTPKLQNRKDNSKQHVPLENHKFAGQKETSINEVISRRLAEWRSSDRSNFISEYYTWNESYSELLRPSEGRPKTVVADDTKNDNNDRQLTKREMLELGRRAMLGAENISRAMESLDRGKDMRSFRSWNSSISLRSGAGTRRRYVLDAVSLPVKFDSRTASPKGPNAGMSLASTEGSDMEEDVDGDALLLRLAAHDEIWRSQVIDALKNARDKVADGAVSDESDDEEEVASSDDVEDPIAKELGAFLFGEKLAKVVTRKKKSKALPPDEITAVLFDLSTNLASTMPDEVAVGDGTASVGLKSTLVPFSGRRNPEAGSSVILATRFVLDEALAVWLETFRPLPWESRRVLWPQAKPPQNGMDGRSQSTFSDNDSLTLDSGASPTTAFTNSTSATQSKDLRQQIEDQELDVETRAETCFLVTYYFTQRLLPKLAAGCNAKATGELVAFVRRYGAYMKLHTSLAYAAALECADVINELLALAEQDLRHREVMKLFSRRHALILYEPTMLSAVVKCLPIIREESSIERRQVLVDVCVSAYPDLCPWQVRQALVSFDDAKGDSKGDKKLEDLYYYYLSNLLHPQDGHEAARLDSALVEEWCELSLDAKSINGYGGGNSRMKNFLSVASLNSSDHLGYHRDLPMLIRLSMSSHQYHLSLDIANEIVSNPTLARDKSTLHLVLGYLREIAHNALDKGDQHEMFSTLKRVVRLFQYMWESSDQQFFSIADELHGVMEYKERKGDSSKNLLELVHFLARESPPSDFLQAFNTWTATHQMPHDTVPVLQAVLKRGTRVALNAALSGSLLRLRRARQRMTKGRDVSPPSTTYSPQEEEPTVWRKMAAGLVAIDK